MFLQGWLCSACLCCPKWLKPAPTPAVSAVPPPASVSVPVPGWAGLGLATAASVALIPVLACVRGPAGVHLVLA